METQTTRSPSPHRDAPDGAIPSQSHPDNPGTPESCYDDPVMDAIIASLPDTFETYLPGSVIVIKAEDSSSDSETQVTCSPETRPSHRDIPDGIIPPPPDPVDPGTAESFFDDPVTDVVAIRAGDSSNSSEMTTHHPLGRGASDGTTSSSPYPDDPGTPDSFYDDPVINAIIASLPDTFEPLPPGGVIVIQVKDSSANPPSGSEGNSDYPVAIDNVGALDDRSGKELE